MSRSASSLLACLVFVSVLPACSHTLQVENQKLVPPPKPPKNEDLQKSEALAAFTSETKKVTLTEWMSIPNCNGFEIVYQRDLSEINFARCEPNSQARTFGSWPLQSNLKLDAAQKEQTEAIIAKLKLSQQKTSGTECGGIGGGSTDFTFESKNGDSTTLVQNSTFCEEPSSIAVEDQLIQDVRDELKRFVETLVIQNETEPLLTK